MIPEHITKIFNVQYIESSGGEPGFWFVRSADHKMTHSKLRKLREAGFRHGWHTVNGPPPVAGWQKINKGEE